MRKDNLLFSRYMGSRSWSLFFCLFLAAWCYFFLFTGWYPKACLEISGIAPERAGKLDVLWDSGQGLNPYEHQSFFLEPAPIPHGLSAITVRFTGSKHGASLSNEVVCSRILVDEKPVSDTQPDQDSGSGHKIIQNIALTKDGDAISLEVPAKKHIFIELLTNNHSGMVEVTVNGRARTYDLYIANVEAKSIGLHFWLVDGAGDFSVAMDVPRYSIRQLIVRNPSPEHPLRLRDMRLHAPGKTREFGFTDGKQPQFSFATPNSGFKRLFHPVLFAWQIVFALLTAWMLSALLRLLSQLGGLRQVVHSASCRPFLLFFVGSLLTSSFWLVAYWPGVMSVDSLKIWRAAQYPEMVLYDHPFLNVIFYRYLIGLWNHVAMVPVAHILLSATLVATVYSWLLRQKVPRLVLIPCYLFLIFSLPVGLYNVVLWKDIPFALLICFWGFTLVRLFHRKRQGEQIVSWEEGAALFLLYLAIGLVRHNGLMYLIVIPLFMVFLLPVSRRRIIVSALVLTVSLGLLGVITLRLFPTLQEVAQRSFQFNVESLRALPKTVVRRGQDYLKVLDFDQATSKWDRFHFFLHDRYAYGFLKRAGWDDAYPYLPQKPAVARIRHAADWLYKKSYQQPWIYFTWNPVWLIALLPLVLPFCRWLPAASLFSLFVLSQVAGLLLLVHILNWRYYYFLLYSTYFFIPFVFLDLQRIRERSTFRSLT